MSKFLEQVESEMSSLGDEIPSQEMKLSLKDLLNAEDGWMAFPTNTTSESTKDQLKIKWNNQFFIVDIKHVPAEDESTLDDIEQVSKMVGAAVALPTKKEMKKKRGGVFGIGGDPVVKKAIKVRGKAEEILDNFLKGKN